MKNTLFILGFFTLMLLSVVNFVSGIKNHDAYYLVLAIIDIRIANSLGERVEF